MMDAVKGDLMSAAKPASDAAPAALPLLDRFAASLAPAEAESLAAVREYIAWQVNRRGDGFAPDANDDVALRTYLLELRLGGARRAAVEQATAALRRFYAWAR